MQAQPIGIDGVVKAFGIEFIHQSETRVEATMPITPSVMQPFGFLHGGATLALLETVASRGAELMTDFSKELPFGISISARHRKSGKAGLITGVAELNRIDGKKQFWNITAYDESGDVISDGEFMTMIVSLEYLAEKEKRRSAGE